MIRFEAFRKVVTELPNNGEWSALNDLSKLFGWVCIQRDAGWFLTNGLLTPAQVKEINRIVDYLLSTLRPEAQNFVDAFAYNNKLLRAKILDS